MKEKIFKILSLTGFLICLFFLIKSCNRLNDLNNLESKSDTLIRISRTTDTIYRDHHYYHYDTIKIQYPVYIDTQSTIQDYYTFKSMEDSFTGKNYRVLLKDTLYMNSLYARRAMISVTQVDSIINNTITLKDKPRLKGFAGLTLTSNLDKSYIFVNGGLQTKKENIWILGYDPFNGQVQGTYLLKIKIK